MSIWVNDIDREEFFDDPTITNQLISVYHHPLKVGDEDDQVF